MPTDPATNHGMHLITGDGHDPSKSAPKRCGIFQCRKVECNLRSHREFVQSRRKAHRSGRAIDTGQLWTSDGQQPSDSVLEHSVLQVERLISNGFPVLPFGYRESSVFRELAQHYFRDQIDRLIQIHSPHLDRRTYKATMMEHALSNEVFCVCITANAKTDMLMRGHLRIPDRASEMVYAATAHILRQKLGSFKSKDLDWLLILVVALVGFDLAFERTESLTGHHEALRQLVAMKGGIHAVGHTVSYVLNTDRFLAVFTGQYPIFKHTPFLPRLPQNKQPVGPYGAAFERLKGIKTVDERILDLCLEHCQTINLMEKSQISLDPKSPPASNPAAIPYFLYLRDRLNCEGTLLYADYHENQNPKEMANCDTGCSEEKQPFRTLSVSRCILLSILIIEYVTLHANYYTVKVTYLADQLKSILERQSSIHWNTHPDVLLWTTFVLAAIPDYSDDHRWAIWRLRQCLDTRYKKKWPLAIWKDEMLRLLKQHLWAKTLENPFRRTCDELLVRLS